MPDPSPPARGGGLIDRRLLARHGRTTRSFLVGAVGSGLVATAAVVTQAVLLADLIGDTLGRRGTLASLTPLLVGLGAAFAVRAACSWLAELAAQRSAVTIAGDLRRRLLDRALELGPVWLSGERAGELTVTATRGITALEVYFGRYVPLAVLGGLAPLAIVAWVAWTDWISALLLVALVAMVPFLMARFGREAERRTQRQWRQLSSLSARYLELVEGLPTLRAYGRQAQGRREVAAATEGLRVTTMGTLRVAFLSALVMDLLSGLGVGLVAMVLGLRLLHGSLGLSTALAVLLVSPEVFLPLRRAGAEFHASTEGQAAARRILDVLDQVPPVTAPPATPPSTVTGPARSTPASSAGSAGPAIAISALGVTYPNGRVALANLDLEVVAGQHLAVLGPSGSGKSTLLGVLLGLVTPDSGSVVVGGVALGSIPLPEWRRQFAWVPQRPHLFGGSLADNLRLGDPAATDEALAEVVAACGLGSLVAQLPQGLETRVGAGGISLSAGERQRLALARAVLRPAPVIVLDEPVAHLDPATEERLGRSLAPWLATKTVLVAAHRRELLTAIDATLTLALPPEWTAGGPADADHRPAGRPADPAAVGGRA